MSANPAIQTLIDRTLRGDPLALARVITLVERDSPEALHILGQVAPHAGRAYEIGVTGPPGGRKSTVGDIVLAFPRAPSFEAAMG